jgi:dUTP pyrophosphatase
MELPKGFEAHIAPRSSTFKNYGLLQTNSVGIVDESYKGDGDQWFMPVLAMRGGKISRGDRICQFRIAEKMPEIFFEEKTYLDAKNRGGHGSSGVK